MDFTLKDKIDSIIFDVDGVLIDVRPSYHKAIYETFKYYTKKNLKEEDFILVKKKAGINNDWESSSALILMSFGYLTKEEILSYIKSQKTIQKKIFENPYFNYYELVNVFEAFYKTFRTKEKILLERDLLEDLKSRYKMGIVTGRPRDDLMFSLEFFNIKDLFDFIIDDDYTTDKSKRKPSKEALRACVERLESSKGGVYLGDTISDMMMSRSYNEAYSPYVYYVHCDFYDSNIELPKEYVFDVVKNRRRLEELLL